MDKSKPFSLNKTDWIKSILLGIVIAIVGGIQQMLSAHGFDIASWDWGVIANLGISAFGVQLGINFASGEDRKVVTPLGKIG